MELTKFGKIFFESTRGRIVSRLRRGAGSVEELAQELDAVTRQLETRKRFLAIN